MPSPPAVTILKSTDEERWELYAALHIREKLANGQAYIRVRRTSRPAPGRGLRPGTVSQRIDIHLSVNDYRICMAHRYFHESGPVTGPDPKLIQIDDLILKQ